MLSHAPIPSGRVMTSIRPHGSYRHEAFLYRGEDDFLAGTVPFVCDGVAAGQPVMVAIRGSRLPALRSALGPAAAEVLFVDMTELGHNPARIIPGWRRFLDQRCVDDQPVRGVGEPIWAGRRPAEVAEAQLHEALLNVAVDPDTPMWLRCPYDVESLTEAELAEAARSHPILVESGTLRGSCSYAGMQHVEDLFAADLPEPDQPAEGIALPATPAEVAALVDRHAEAAGLAAERAAAAVAGPAGADRCRDSRLPAAGLDRAGRAGLRGPATPTRWTTRWPAGCSLATASRTHAVSGWPTRRATWSRSAPHRTGRPCG